MGCFKLRYIVLKYGNKKCLDLCLCPFCHNACFRDISKQTVLEASCPRLRAVSYFSLQSYCTLNPSTRAAKQRAARNEGVSPRRKSKRPSFLAWSQSLIVIIASWFAIALDEVRTRQILREKADCKQSTCPGAAISRTSLSSR